MTNKSEYSARLAEARQSIADNPLYTSGGTVHLCNLNNGQVIDAPPDIAATTLVYGRHRLATADEIQTYSDDVQRRTEFLRAAEPKKPEAIRELQSRLAKSLGERGGK